MYELLNNCSCVVLLGLSPNTKRIIKALNRDYGICPILYSDIQPAYGWDIFLQYKFIKQLFPSNDYYTVHSVLDINKDVNGGSSILIPIASHFKNILSDNAKIFEKEYIILGEGELINSLPSYHISKKCFRCKEY